MTHSPDLEAQRARFRAIMEGQLPRPCTDIEEAKRHLREVAGEVPVGPLVQAINQRQWERAALQLGLLLMPVAVNRLLESGVLLRLLQRSR
ncbi:MAG: hypothetical protein D6717_11860 [Gammaproteobacteria bacterium]|nr:MAG: hypothetical protein D6717_11860 [Gammaproteobacteria bacterium]